MQNHAVLFKTVSAGVLVFALAACGGQKEAAAPAAASGASAAAPAVEKSKIVFGTTAGDFGDMVRDQV